MSNFMDPAGGGGDPIQEAMGRRGLSSPQQQMSPMSAGFDPAMAQQIQGAIPQQPPEMGQPAPQGSVGPQGNPETKIIIGALKNRLELLGKMGQ